MAAKVEQVRGWLHREGLVGVVFGTQAGFAWITAGGRSEVSIGQEAGAAWVLVTGADAYLGTTNIEVGRLGDEEVAGLPLTAVDWPWHRPELGRATVERLCPRGPVVSDAGMLGLPPAPASLAELRFTLGVDEVERYRRLGADAAEAVEIACQSARPGDAEYDVAARLALECGRRRIVPLVNLVGADERIDRYRHPLPTRHRARRTLLVALTGRRHGLHASLTRMVSFGAPEAERATRHEAVARVDARYLLASRPGASLAEVLAQGIDEYAACGFGEQWQLHHQGGLTGYGGREIFATPTAGHRLGSNQAVAWNPSITGAKSEDTVLVTDEGPEVLTRSPSWPQASAPSALGSFPRPALLARPDE